MLGKSFRLIQQVLQALVSFPLFLRNQSRHPAYLRSHYHLDQLLSHFS